MAFSQSDAMVIDYLHILEGGPWIILGHYVTVVKWRPKLCPSKEDISATTVWVHIPSLPLELFDEDIMLQVGSNLGMAVKVDQSTLTTAHGGLLRCAVKLI